MLDKLCLVWVEDFMDSKLNWKRTCLKLKITIITVKISTSFKFKLHYIGDNKYKYKFYTPALVCY